MSDYLKCASPDSVAFFGRDHGWSHSICSLLGHGLQVAAFSDYQKSYLNKSIGNQSLHFQQQN